MKLQGLRVLDLSLFLPGPHLSMMMADHGAEVIKVEPPGEGDPGRHIGLADDGHTVFFRNANRGKQSIVLNLKNLAAREVLLRLADTADVFLEAFRPGVADKLGVGYREVSARNPRIVYCSISAFGQYGPYRDVPGHDLVVEALAGVVSVNRAADEPALPGVPAADMSASLMALSGILMALLRRETTGRGDYLDIAMHDCLVAWLPNAVGPVFAQKRAPIPREERAWGGAAFYQIYATSDARHVVLGGQELKFVRNLLGELGKIELLALCEQGPGPQQRPLIDFLTHLFASRTQQHWIEWFRGKDIAFGAVKNLREAFDDPQVNARAMHITDARGHEHIGVPIKFAAEPAQPRFTVPQLGEDGRTILSRAGYSTADITQLEAHGALGKP
jgi:crotonobetainyl-CoA:carnitine CoA-transferase CaiB-like acyl-CoA transferase